MVWLAVFLGGGAGSVLRHALGVAGKTALGLGFPVGTLAANILGSFLLGLLARLGLKERGLSPAIEAGLTTGLCGGFTTYSTFNLEALAMLKDGHALRGAGYLAATLVLCGLAGAAGLYLGHRLRS